MTALVDEDRAPSVIVLENVCGTLTSHGGKDFRSICKALCDGGYRFGALVVDAVLFVPQSRPRLLIIAVKREIPIPSALSVDRAGTLFHSRPLMSAFEKLPPKFKGNWIWWNLPVPAPRNAGLSDFIEECPRDVAWHKPSETRRLLGMMSDVNLNKVMSAKDKARRIVGTIYKRTRSDCNARKVQRAEVRFDNVAGCLRTPAGGSSRQLVIVVEGKEVRTRLISSREDGAPHGTFGRVHSSEQLQ